MSYTPAKFDAYAFLNRVIKGSNEDQIMLTDEFRATDLGMMLKAALRAIEILGERVADLEKMSGKLKLPEKASKDAFPS